MNYELSFNEQGILIAVYREGAKVPSGQLFPAPETFNPKIHTATLVNNIVSISNIVAQQSTIDPIRQKSIKYPKLRVIGVEFCDIMMAKLDSLTIACFTVQEIIDIKALLRVNTDEEVLEGCKAHLDAKFGSIRLYLESGRFKSAKRGMITISASSIIKQETIDEITIFIDSTIAKHYG